MTSVIAPEDTRNFSKLIDAFSAVDMQASFDRRLFWAGFHFSSLKSHGATPEEAERIARRCRDYELSWHRQAFARAICAMDAGPSEAKPAPRLLKLDAYMASNALMMALLRENCHDLTEGDVALFEAFDRRSKGHTHSLSRGTLDFIRGKVEAQGHWLAKLQCKG